MICIIISLSCTYRFHKQRKSDQSYQIYNNIFITLVLCFVSVLIMHNGKFCYVCQFAEGFIEPTDLLTIINYHLFYTSPYYIIYIITYILSFYISFRTKCWYFLYLTTSLSCTFLIFTSSRTNVELVTGKSFSVLMILAFVYLLFMKNTLSYHSYKCTIFFVILYASIICLWYSPITYSREISSMFYFTNVTILGLFLLMVKSGRSNPVNLCNLFWLYFVFILFNQDYYFSSNFTNLFNYVLTFPAYFIEPVVCSVIIFTAYKVLGKKTAGFSVLIDLIAVFIISLYLIDLFVYLNYESRLDWDVINLTTDMALVLKSVKHLPLALTVIIIFILTLYIMSPSLLKMVSLSRLKKFLPSRTVLAIIMLFSTAVFISYPLPKDKLRNGAITNLFITLPYFNQADHEVVSKQEFQNIWSNYSLPKVKSEPKTYQRNKMNVLFILMESSYNKYLSHFGFEQETQPFTKKYLDRMELFTNFYSNYPNSFHARFSSTSGLYAIKEYISQVNPRIKCRTIFDVLKKHNYQTSLFYSSFRNYTNLWDFLKSRRIDSFYDCSNMPFQTKKVNWGISELDTINSIKKQISQYSQSDKNFFLTYIPACPHPPFDGIPEEFNKFEDSAESIFNSDKTPAYFNALIYMDYLIASILDKLKETGQLDNTLVVISNDHGEWVEGRRGHGFDVNPEMTNTPLIIMNPEKKGYRMNDTLGSQVDIMPTVLDLLSIPKPKNSLLQGSSLYGKQNPNKVVMLNSGLERGFVKGSDYFREADGVWRHYIISRNEAKTVFTEQASETLSVEQQSEFLEFLNKFDVFQNSFIRNYGYYLNLKEELE